MDKQEVFIMYMTQEGYLFTRGIERVKPKQGKFVMFVKRHKVLLSASAIVISLIVLEAVLLSKFMQLLLIL